MVVKANESFGHCHLSSREGSCERNSLSNSRSMLRGVNQQIYLHFIGPVFMAFDNNILTAAYFYCVTYPNLPVIIS